MFNAMDTPIQAPDLGRAADPLLPREIGELGPGELFVNEFFLSIQGESTFAGLPCFFLRLAGCHLRCSYCDTEYAFHEGHRETVEGCIEKAAASGCRLVEVTGGEPLIQKAVHPLLSGLCDRGFTVLLETAGAVDLRRVDPRVRKIVDVKCPSSGMASRNLPDLAAQVRPGDEVKLVIGDRADYAWARGWLERAERTLPREVPVLFSPVHGRLAPRQLAAWILEDRLPVRLQLQIHKVIWPEATRGF
jgi:7-carboxy-7-deazaguanine synthase